MMQAETNLMRRIQDALNRIPGCRAWRNEVGRGWVGNGHRRDDGIAIIKNARYLTFGLPVGSSDLIGIAPDGRFLAIEVKTKRGRKREEQEKFIRMIRSLNGRAGVARSIEEAIKIATEPIDVY